MNNINEPKYDTDLVNKAYVDKLVGGVEEETIKQVGSVSKIYTTTPTTPYKVGNLYTDGKDIYVCIRDKDFGAYDANDWQLASDYTNDDVANRKNTVFTSQPTPPYIVGDLWTIEENNAPGELYKCIRSRTSGSFNASDWELATKYDNTKTTIDGGIVTSGTVQLAGSSGAIKAGITGNGTADTDIRIWAGNTYGNRGSAPFRVTQGGFLYAENANIAGTITAKEGKIGAWTLNAYKLYATSNTGEVAVVQVPGYEYEPGKRTSTVFAAGGTNHNNYTDCPFRVSGDGYLYSTHGYIAGWTIAPDRLYTANNGIYANGEAYFYPTGGGVFALNDGCQLRGPGGVLLAADGSNSITMPGQGNMRIQAPKSMNLEANAIGIDATNYVRIQDLYFSGTTITSKAYSGTNITLYYNNTIKSNNHVLLQPSSSGNAYVGTAESTNRILTSADGISSRNVKTNIKVIDEYDALYKDLQNLDMYTYDYKYKGIRENKSDFGFIIDDIDASPTLHKYCRNYDTVSQLDEDTLIPGWKEVKHKTTKIRHKNWDKESYIKMNLILIKTLQDKIDKLEERIKVLEGGN